MLTWARAKRLRTCGSCGRSIGIGDPLLLLTITRIEKIRCETCAGPAPPELPAFLETTPTPLRFPARLLPFDWKAAQAREPGEEG